jgi:hypothetical protein
MKKITKATIKSILRNGGATFNKRNERVILKSGYQVSKCDMFIIPAEELTAQIIMTNLALIERGEYLGLWVNEGLVYVDISRRVATKKDAMRIGKEFNQLSILKWATMECLNVV